MNATSTQKRKKRKSEGKGKTAADVIASFGPAPDFSDPAQINLQIGFLARVLGHRFSPEGKVTLENRAAFMAQLARLFRQSCYDDARFAYFVGKLVAKIGLWEEEGVERTCRVCGCTEKDGCASGCSWIDAELCSECFGPEMKRVDAVAVRAARANEKRRAAA